MSIMLSFGATAANGAWDDRELVSAYDTAMAEFHAHHPGPGSWLDKVTAQKQLEEQAGSSSQTNPVWYSAPEVIHDQQEEEEEPKHPPPRPKKRPKNRDHHSTLSHDRPPNPYISNTTTGQQAVATPASPQYSPPSPESANSPDPALTYDLSMPRLNIRNSAEKVSRTEAAPNSTVQQYPPPPAPISIAPITAVSAADALSYAMTSQYWAGYWMGVSQAIQHGDKEEPAMSDPSDQLEPAKASDPSLRSNVVVTKHMVLRR